MVIGLNEMMEKISVKRVRRIAGSPLVHCAFNSQEAAQSSRRNLLHCRAGVVQFVTTAKPTPLLLVKRLQVKPNQISSLLHQFQHRNGHRLDAGAQRGLGQWLEEG